MPLHPQVEWQATLRTLEDTQTLVASWLLEQGIRRASDVNPVLLDGNSGRLDLAKDQVGGGTALTKDGGWILGEQEEHHPICFLFVSYLGNSLEMIHSSNPFLCWWNVMKRIVNDWNGTGHRDGKNYVCGNGGCFFGCFVRKIVTCMEEWPGIDWTNTEDNIKLMEL